jgi:hypothetical protein
MPHQPTVEEWRPAVWHKDVLVGSFGSVRLCPTTGQEVELNQFPRGQRGYRAVCVRGKSVYVHQLVADTFLGPRPDGQVVVHVDGNPDNNNAENLAYGTRGDVQRKAYDRGTKKPTYRRGPSRRTAGLDEAKVREIRENPDVPTPVFAAKFFVTNNCIACVRSRKTWRHLP